MLKAALTLSGDARFTARRYPGSMTMLSHRLSRALAQGRTTPPPPQSRASLLATLLRKRATAHNVGAEDLEALLRDQIRWALPIERVPHSAE